MFNCVFGENATRMFKGDRLLEIHQNECVFPARKRADLISCRALAKLRTKANGLNSATQRHSKLDIEGFKEFLRHLYVFTISNPDFRGHFGCDGPRRSRTV